MKIRTIGMLVTMSVFGSGTALAQDAATGRFGQQGQFAISAERMFGVASTSFTVEQTGGGEQTDSATSFSLLSSQMGAFFNAYVTPRIGLDYFVIDGLTLGAAFGVFSTSTSVTDKPPGAGSTTQDGPTYTGVILAPRIGYAYMFSDMVGIWPRLGFTYVGVGSKDSGPQPDESGVHLSAITLEAPLIISPFEHMGFLVAPVADIGVGGSRTTKDGQTGVETTRDAKATEFGLLGGLFVYL